MQAAGGIAGRARRDDQEVETGATSLFGKSRQDRPRARRASGPKNKTDFGRPPYNQRVRRRVIDLVAVALGLAALTGFSSPQVAAPNNVLIVLVDDLGAEWLSPWGGVSPMPATPNIDALIADGVTFTNFWAYPMCSPTRAAIQTGRYGFRTGMGAIATPSYPLPLDEVLLPELLDHGSGGTYQHALFGKWHLGTTGGLWAPNVAGWGHYSGVLPGVSAVQSYELWSKVTDGVLSTSTEYVTTEVVDDALAWMTAQTDPWLCFVSMLSVHNPFHAPPEHLHSQDLSGAGPPTEDCVPYYLAMIEALDTELGRLLAPIDPGDTAVIFLSDNGTPVPCTLPPIEPDHVKQSLFEPGIRVPLIVTGPLVEEPGGSCSALVNATDLFATVADLAGIDLEAEGPGVTLDSQSLVPYLENPSLASQRPWIFSEHFIPNGPRSDPPQPAMTEPVCQQDLGLQGPGNAVLSMCGLPLVQYAATELLLEGAPPGATVFLGFGITWDPIAVFGGTVGPNPLIWVNVEFADEQGEVRLEVPNSASSAVTLYMQGAVLDDGQEQGVALTNALQAEFLPWDTKAIRNDTTKLVLDIHGGYHRLYDLELDPLETTNLLDAPLSTEHEADYLELLSAVTDLITQP